jgi:hypothetical protein
MRYATRCVHACADLTNHKTSKTGYLLDDINEFRLPSSIVESIAMRPVRRAPIRGKGKPPEPQQQQALQAT